MPKYLLAYDADCGPCTKFKRSIEFLDTYGKLDFMPLSEADDKGFLDPIPWRLRHRSFHLISPEGEALSGAKALPALMSLLPSGTLISRLMMSAPGGLRMTNFIYGVGSRLHDTGSCRYKPGQTHRHLTKSELSRQNFGFLR